MSRDWVRDMFMRFAADLRVIDATHLCPIPTSTLIVAENEEAARAYDARLRPTGVDFQVPIEWNADSDPLADIERFRQMVVSPPDFVAFTESFADAVAQRYGMTVDDLLRPIPASDELRPKRDRRNRGPQQHGKWWKR